MLDRFAELLAQVFPSIEPEVRRRFVDAIRENRIISAELYAASLPSGICQGDILGPIDLRYLDDDGSWFQHSGYALVLSNTCDASSVDLISVAACWSYPDFSSPASDRPKGFLPSVRANEITNYFYLPDVPKIGSVVAELNFVSSVSRSFLEEAIHGGKVSRVSAFSQLGYYLFLSKITVHFLRPETDEISRNSLEPTLRRRLKEAGRVLLGKW